MSLRVAMRRVLEFREPNDDCSAFLGNVWKSLRRNSHDDLQQAHINTPIRVHFYGYRPEHCVPRQGRWLRWTLFLGTYLTKDVAHGECSDDQNREPHPTSARDL